ncbi:MAG: Glu-tRNA(Gln) amidotransferase subunit GatE [Thermoplasmatota archaeon]|jgi:glutamyl-tRNA(Gln) amidotransferase subunit E
MDYEKIGFKAGLEIHQQLNTCKLFCSCPSNLKDDFDYSFKRFLRLTSSELGELDVAAVAEAEKNRYFVYNASSDSTCLVEADEEPPHDVNSEAVDICLTAALLMKAKVVDEIHFMRKIVIDGSNTSGFQRTALVAVDGKIDDVSIKTIALEEDAARKIEEKGSIVNYALDRLGISLIEIVTGADIKSPEHARATAEKIGLILQSTDKVKKGLGTIRQDLNISIFNGKRVEIKGIQSLSSISRVAEKEVLRQIGLINIMETLKQRVDKHDLQQVKLVEVSSCLKDCKSNIVKKLLKDGCAKAIKLAGFKGLLKQVDTRLGKEFAVAAKIATGIGGIIHSDELPGYGIEQKEVDSLSLLLQLKGHDAMVIAIGKEDVVDNALKVVLKRAEKAFDGVQNEVRKALPDDTTEYLRPMPGAARMYPETDVKPIRITKDVINRLKNNLPETLDEKFKRFKKDFLINDEQTRQLLLSGYENDFEKLMKKFPEQKNVIIRTFLNTFSELEKEKIDINTIDEQMLTSVFSSLSQGKFSKEAIPMVLKYLLTNKKSTIDEAIKNCGLCMVDAKEIENIVNKILIEKKDFVKQKKLDALKPLMGEVMKQLRGKADGKTINEILKKEIEKII